jgi:hypothetical protein
MHQKAGLGVVGHWEALKKGTLLGVPRACDALVKGAEQMQEDDDENRYACHPQDEVAEHGCSPIRLFAGAARQTRSEPGSNGRDGGHLLTPQTTQPLGRGPSLRLSRTQ